MLYDTILCVVDSEQNQLTQDRVTEFVRLTGTAVHLVYLAAEHSIPGSPDGGTDVEIDEQHVRNLQEYLARAIASGVEARGEIVAATHYGRSEAILERAKAVKADLVILNTEVGGQKAKAKLAEKIVARNDRMAVLIARSTVAFAQRNSG
jgi:MFS transporter, AAHS family, benzoate transport protein